MSSDEHSGASTNRSPAGEEDAGAPIDGSPETAEEQLTGSDLHPWFVCFDSDKPENQNFCQISPWGPLGSQSRCLPELKDNEIKYCTPDGRWLLLLGRHGGVLRASIWNSISKVSIELPSLAGTHCNIAVISCSPDDPKCMIYMFPYEGRHFFFCRIGDERWTSFKYGASVRAQIRRCDRSTHRHSCCHIHQPVSLKGKVYGLLTCFHELVEISVDASNNCSCTVLTQNPELPLLDASRLYLVPWEDGHLYLITSVSYYCHDFVFRESRDIRVTEFNFSTSSWHVVPSLNGGAVFLGDSYSLASSSHGKQEWSFIYYTADHNQMLFSHRMEDGKITSYAPCPNYLPSRQEKRLQLQIPSLLEGRLQLPFQKEQLWLPHWIMPEPRYLEGTSKPIDNSGSNITMHCSKNPEVMDINWHNPLKHCSKKRKVVENLPVDADCSKKQKVVENVTMDAEGGCTLMHDSKEQMVVENGSARQVYSTTLCDLSPELIERVAEKVTSFVEYTYFLHANKLGSDVARRRENKFRPCLIYKDKMEASFYHIIDSEMSRGVHVEMPQQVRGKRIGCCRYGWLLVEDGNTCCLFNPLTRHVIETLGYKCRNGGSGISNLTFIGGKPSPYFPDKSSVLAMTLRSPFQGSRLEPGDAAEAGKAVWWKLRVEKFQASCNSPVLLGDDWYYLGHGRSTGRLGRLRLTNMEEGEFEWEVKAVKNPCRYARSFLIECGGELLSVFIGEEHEEVRVFKIRGDTEKKWQEMDSLGGYCLYLGLASSISCVAETLDMADRIYLPKFHKDGLVYYSLKTKKWHSVGNEQDEVKRHHPITMFSDCAWIIPDFSC